MKKGTVVATLSAPIPINDGLVEATKGLEKLYGVKLVMLPFGKDDDFAEIAVA